MITAARRTVLGLLGLATVNALNARARAQEVVPARRPGDVAPEGVGLSVPPGPLVSGTYEIVHQEGYAVALLAVGFSQDTLLQQLRLGPQRITIAAAPSTISFGFGSDVRSRVPLNSPIAIDIPGAHITDWLARFDLPSRQIITFTAPDGRRVKATQTFSSQGYISLLAIDGAPEFKPARMWRRVVEGVDVRRQPKGHLLPI
jgi:hypothetical protein